MVIFRYCRLTIADRLIDILSGTAIFSRLFDFLISWFLIGSIEAGSRVAEVHRGRGGQG